MITSLLFIVTLAVLAGGIYIVVPILAKLNFVFSKDDEGYGKIVMKGGKAFQYFGGLPDGRRYDKETGELILGQSRSFLSKRLGVRFIGIPPLFKIDSYRFSWFKWAMLPNSTEYGLVRKDEIINKTRISATYALKVTGAETKDRLAIDVVLQFVVVIVNLAKARFKTNDWLANVSAAISSAVRDFIANKDFNDLIVLKNEIGAISGSKNSEFVGSILSLNNDSVGNISLVEQIGIFIESINLVSLAIGEPQGELAKATQARYVEEQRAAGVMASKDADAAKILAEIKAKADGYALELASVGGDPKILVAIKNAEAIQKHQGTLVMGSNSPAMLSVDDERSAG